MYGQTIDSSQKKNLIDKAFEAQQCAYAPYSNYHVGAALLTKNGQIISGCNVENASYGLTNCAERSAIFSAVSQGKKEFVAMAVITKDGGSPCGGCRQVLNEFNPDMLIIMCDNTKKITQETTLTHLLPTAFGPHNLQ